MKTFLTSIFLLILSTTLSTSWAQKPRYFSLGADISSTTQMESFGVRQRNAQGDTIENTRLMKDLGLDGVRLRVWVNPKFVWSSPTDVLVMALRAKEAGMDVMVDFHYSDWWADPGKQYIPEAWKDLPFEDQVKALADHTKNTLQLLKNYGIDVRWVQVGNETTNGMMWPVGNVPEHMEQYAALSQAGYDAVKEIYPNAEVIVHLDNGWNPEIYNRMFDGLKKYGAKWDIIGMSVYPYWTQKEHPDYTEEKIIADTVKNILDLKEKYGTESMIVETGVEAANPVPGKEFMANLIDAMYNKTNGNCLGVYYWEPQISHGYPLGAFQNDQPTVIMDAFTEAAAKINSIE